MNHGGSMMVNESLEGNIFRMPDTGYPWVLTTTYRIYRGSVQKPLQIILGVPGSGD
jgi:hypothetical protein